MRWVSFRGESIFVPLDSIPDLIKNCGAHLLNDGVLK